MLTQAVLAIAFASQISAACAMPYLVWCQHRTLPSSTARLQASTHAGKPKRRPATELSSGGTAFRTTQRSA
jgi:hypothetical protein